MLVRVKAPWSVQAAQLALVGLAGLAGLVLVGRGGCLLRVCAEQKIPARRPAADPTTEGPASGSPVEGDALLAAASPSDQPEPLARAPPLSPEHVRLGAWNVYWRATDSAQGRAAIGAALDASGPYDVFAMIEAAGQSAASRFPGWVRASATRFSAKVFLYHARTDRRVYNLRRHMHIEPTRECLSVYAFLCSHAVPTYAVHPLHRDVARSSRAGVPPLLLPRGHRCRGHARRAAGAPRSRLTEYLGEFDL